MSQFTKFLRAGLARTPLRNVQKYRQADGQEKVKRWMANMTSKASTTESRSYVAQLSSVLNFYTRPVSNEAQPTVNWNQWKEQLFTEGLVDKVKQNHDSLKAEEYNVEGVISQIISAPSKELEEISNELYFHGAVWANAYADYASFLYELQEYGNSNDYLMHENYDFFYGLETELEELIETHNYIAGSKDDINLRGYYAAQFNWGKKVISFYRHPGDDFKGGRATKNILGR